ncbi:unnamed protein product, partial [Prunus brigantina]
MSRTPTILPLIADSKKHVINPADPTTRTHAFIATTKDSTFHTSSQKFAWIINSGAMDHMTFDPSQLISRKSSTQVAASNANGTPSPVPADTPIEINHKLCEDMDQEPTNKEQYQHLVGRLIYLAHTIPNIAYAMSMVSQFMHSPSVFHRNAVDQILRYLMFSKNGDLEVVGYTDADWAGSITDRRSTSGYFTFVGGNLITWQRKKQNVVSRSSAETEY